MNEGAPETEVSRYRDPHHGDAARVCLCPFLCSVMQPCECRFRYQTKHHSPGSFGLLLPFFDRRRAQLMRESMIQDFAEGRQMGGIQYSV